MTTVTLRDTATAVESLEVPITTTVDPTAVAPQFALSAPGATAPGSWSPGGWVGSWSAATGRTVAATPLIGRTGVMVIASGNDYDLWARVIVDVESFEWPVGRIHVP